MKLKILFVILLLFTSVVVSGEPNFDYEEIVIENDNPDMLTIINKYDNIDENGKIKTAIVYYARLDWLVVRVYQPNVLPYDEYKFEYFYSITLQDWLKRRSPESKYYHYMAQKRTLWYNKIIDGTPNIVFDIHISLFRD